MVLTEHFGIYWFLAQGGAPDIVAKIQNQSNFTSTSQFGGIFNSYDIHLYKFTFLLILGALCKLHFHLGRLFDYSFSFCAFQLVLVPYNVGRERLKDVFVIVRTKRCSSLMELNLHFILLM